jgi:hypothetical protein
VPWLDLTKDGGEGPNKVFHQEVQVEEIRLDGFFLHESDTSLSYRLSGFY